MDDDLGGTTAFSRVGCGSDDDLVAKELRIRYAAASRPDVVLFGNSRIAGVAEADVQIAGLDVFNMGWPGTTFRQSIAFAEEMARRAPPKAMVFSLDNFDLHYAQQRFEWPPGPARWKTLVDDAAYLLREENRNFSDLAEFARGRLRIEEPTSFARMLSLRHLSTRFSALAGLEAPCDWTLMRKSHGAPPLSSDFDGRTPPFIESPEVRYPLLERDLDRLERVARTGVAVIVFESSYHPDIEARLAAVQSGQNKELRQRFLDGCRIRGLFCHPASAIPGTPEGGYWSDYTHAPTVALGRIIAGYAEYALSRKKTAE